MKLSIVVATCDRPAALARCLAAVTEHRTHHDVEVITVHAPGDDASHAMVTQRFPTVRTLVGEQRNVAHQRNVGAASAHGDILLFLDDDAWPDDACFDALVDAFAADPGLAEAGGPVLDPDGSLQMGPTAISRFARTRPVPTPDDVDAGFVFQITGCNMAIRADVLLAVNGFDESYAYHLDDSDVAIRIHDAGHRIGWVEGARVFHDRAAGPHRRTLWDRDWRSVAMNDVYFAFRHVRRGRWRLALVPWLLQMGRALRLGAWLLKGRLGPVAFARCETRLFLGTIAGYRKAWAAR